MSEDKAEEGAANAEQIQEFKLGPDEELRFEVEANKGQVVTAVVSMHAYTIHLHTSSLHIHFHLYSQSNQRQQINIKYYVF